MPVLMKLVAVCDICNARQEYESAVGHDRCVETTSCPDPHLNASDVLHMYGLPDGWGDYQVSYVDQTVCPRCIPELPKHARRI